MILAIRIVLFCLLIWPTLPHKNFSLVLIQTYKNLVRFRAVSYDSTYCMKMLKLDLLCGVNGILHTADCCVKQYVSLCRTAYPFST